MAPRRSRRALPVAALALAVAAVGAIVLSSRGGGDPPAQRALQTPVAEESPAATPTPRAKAPREPAPARAVRGFYEAAADDDWDRAWALAGPQFRAQFGSLEGVQRGLDSLQKIRFRTLRVLERGRDRATISVQTVATHTGRVDRCAGTLLAVRVDGAWRADPLSLDCRSG